MARSRKKQAFVVVVPAALLLGCPSGTQTGGGGVTGTSGDRNENDRPASYGPRERSQDGNGCAASMSIGNPPLVRYTPVSCTAPIEPGPPGYSTCLVAGLDPNGNLSGKVAVACTGNFTPPATTTPPPTTRTTLNAKDASGRTIYKAWDGKGCHIERPDKNPPHAPPGMMATEAIPCPPSMNDPAWSACLGGQITKAGDDCVCSVSGNPPPPDKSVSCPKSS